MINICGDSFAVPDLEYGPCWVDLLSEVVPLRNHAEICASNFAISQQVNQAIALRPKLIIVLFSSSIRLNTIRNSKLISYSVQSLDETTPFTNDELMVLKSYTADFFDLSIAIQQNELIIEATLQRLVESKIPFIFDQGGFEHPSYGGTRNEYFARYKSQRSDINIWDYTTTRAYRPYYHITDIKVHKHIANYYYQKYREQT